ncbi:MAG: tRNA nucleotidyltransferase [Oscillospiraceae bacterium]|nr:tRNA nucleotidyltransferase [Oscillospiraceae bacterium]
MFPPYVHFVLDTLAAHGYAAYVVGGAVRDLLCALTPDDHDAATDAPPEKVLEIFGTAARPTGLRHGTVTVVCEGKCVEVTTFRCDGAYRDGRHPESVRFTRDIEKDLARRDFTINAMAMAADGTLVDPFGGQEDLARGVLRCVGSPEVRFSEDALRILRALRFAAVCGFSIEAETAAALHEKRELLSGLAAERVFHEMTRTVCGRHVCNVLLEYADVFGVWIPEILPCIGFDQKSRFHIYDVWEHTVRAMAAAPCAAALRWHLLFHDLGKPASFTLDELGRGHTYGHTAVSARMAAPIMERLRFPNDLRRQIETLLSWHDRQFSPTRAQVLRVLSEIGAEAFFDLLDAKCADNAAKRPEGLEAAQKPWEDARLLGRELLDEGACFTLSQLAVDGNDAVSLGFSGRAVGEALRAALDAVMRGEVENERKTLLRFLASGKKV